MANPEHLIILRQGVKTWNQRREGNPEVIPDFEGANLSKADLSEADLSRTNLSGANLSGADFTACFHDQRNPSYITHEVREMIGQQVYSLALGYEDLNDQEFLRHDPLPGLLAGKQKLGEGPLRSGILTGGTPYGNSCRCIMRAARMTEMKAIMVMTITIVQGNGLTSRLLLASKYGISYPLMMWCKRSGYRLRGEITTATKEWK